MKIPNKYWFSYILGGIVIGCSAFIIGFYYLIQLIEKLTT